MTRRTILAMALALLLVMAQAGGALAAVTEKGTLPVVDEPITIKAAVPVNAKVEDISTNAYTLWLENQTGIHLDITELSPADTATQVNTMMVSGDLPEIFLGYSFSYVEMASYAEAGLLMPLNEYIELYGDEYYVFCEQMKSVVGAVEPFISLDGQIYAMPSCSNMITDMYAGVKMRVQGLFLEALGMEMPTTLDGFYDYLVAVRDNDVNGNGDPNDEIPMTGYASRDLLTGNIGCCYQYTDNATYLKLNAEGNVEFIATNDLFKETIEFIKKLVDEKLLDPAFFTQDQATLLTLNTGAVPVVGADVSYLSGSYDSSTDTFANLMITPNLVGPHGYSATKVNMPAIGRGMAITTKCENPAAAYRMFDYMLTDYAGAVGRLGTENEHWKRAEEGLVGRDGEPAWYELIGTQVWTWPSHNIIWQSNAIMHGDVMNHVAEKPDSSPGKLAAAVFKYDLQGGVTGEQLPTLLMDTETMAEYNEVCKLIVNYVNTNIAQFALGDRPLAEWDSYVSELENMGLQYYVQLANDAYKAMQ